MKEENQSDIPCGESVYLYTHPGTKWEQIREEIEIMILKGLLKSGERLPSVAETASMFSVGKTTAQKALESLYTDGIVSSERRKGYFVKPDMKEELGEKYMEEIIKSFDKYISIANKMGMKEDELTTLFMERLEKMKSANNKEK